MATMSENSMRRACWDNVITKSALSAFNGVGNAWFVDGSSGLDTNKGDTWSSGFLTIAAAVSACSAGDAIFIKGSLSEAVTCTKVGVKFIGTGTGPHQATWTAPTVAGSFCLKLNAADCYVENIKFKPVIYTSSGIPSAILLSTAPYTTIKNCRFQGQASSYTAIYSPVCDSDNVTIDGCEFIYMNTITNGVAILGVEAGGLCYSNWTIKNCVFSSCYADINLAGLCCVLKGNTHPIGGVLATGAVNAAVTAGLAIDLSGTGSGGNIVTGCNLGGAYTSSLYVGGTAGDCWAGNSAAITSTYCPNGITVPTKPA